MITLEGTRTRVNLEHAFTQESCVKKRVLNHELPTDGTGYPELSALSRTMAENSACFASGHRDFLAADDDGLTPSRMSPLEAAARLSEVIDDHTAMYAGMARTAREEGFEEIAGWFETLAKAGSSNCRRLRHVINQYRTET